ncbi:putative F-box protein At1g50880 [Bidens hawaiensis]|uniref:putative F-box protein At1g50880 n=1 Tax=Bidens hawaiensis TaxID=980011 RepID=UPI00404947CB
MTNNVGNDILYNILARLPGKPLLRFRCVSKHWNGLISDPYFMKSRSRRMIHVTLLGSIGGCLCVVNKVDSTRFDVWLMKEEWSWMKAHSFTFP